MLLRRLIASLSCLFLLMTQSTVAVAQDSSDSQKSPSDGALTEPEKPPSIEAQTARALRIGLVDGIIRFVQNSARAKIKIDWEPLPIDKTIIKAAGKYGYSPRTITIRNEDLVGAKWLSKISATDKKLLQEALGIPNLENLGKLSDNDKQFWSLQNPTVRDLLKAKSLEVSDYFGLNRDRNILLTLLESNGISYSFESQGLGVPSTNPRISDEKINWRIIVYKFTVKQKPEISFYRFGVKAEIEPFDLILPKRLSENTTVEIKARIFFKQSDNIIGLLDNVRDFVISRNINIVLEKNQEKLIEDLEKNNSATELQGLLTFAGGSSKLGEVISRGLLGGTKSTSIVSGGIVDFADGNISPLIGVNQELAKFGESSAGFLFGAGLGDSTSLFIGPSLQASIFTLSAGGLALEGKKDPEVHLAGIISIDLSRLTRSKETTNEINIKEGDIGGNWGVASESISSNLALLEWTLNSTDTQFKNFRLRKVCNSQGIAVDSKEQALVSIKAGNTNVIKFVPKGIYKYEGIPEGFQLRAVSLEGDSIVTAPIAPDTGSVNLVENSLESITWEIVKVRDRETGSDLKSEAKKDNVDNNNEEFCQQAVLKKD